MNQQNSYPLQKRNVFNLIISIAALVILTLIHHIYGAIHYQTPWRLHTLHINIPALALVVGLLLFSLKDYEKKILLRRISIIIISLVWLIWVGAYEGVYNHLIKDILYFSGTPLEIMQTLFPPPTYEMPDDFIFEATGILQILPIWMIWKYSALVFKK